MSLFTDLKEVFTEYAQRIKGLAAADEEIKADLSNIKPGLSDDAKKALLACFENVAWKGTNAQEFIIALRKALTDILIIPSAELKNFSMWSSLYPYRTANNAKLSYSKLDISAVGGNIYHIDATVLQSAILMRIDIYNQNILDSYTNESNISFDDIVTLIPWTSAYDHEIVIPKYINNSPTAGMVFIFSYSDNRNISNNEVASIAIEELLTGTLPPDYTAYDYITLTGTSGITVDATGVIQTVVYSDLGHANISLDYLATSNLGTSNIPIIGGRGENDWEHTVFIYITSGKDYTVNSHGSKVISDAVTKNKINHIDLRQGSASPSIVVANGAKTEIVWNHDNTVYTPMYLFCNPVYNVATSFSLSANVQLGQFVICEKNSDPDVYIPVVRNNDNVIGIFNVTRQEFHTCSDARKATLGNSNCIYRVGNWV